MGEHPWDRTHLACTRSPDTGCTRDACAPRRTLPMDQPRIFIGDTKTQRNLAKNGRIFGWTGSGSIDTILCRSMRNGLRAFLQIAAALAASFAAQGDALRPGLVATYRDTG